MAYSIIAENLSKKYQLGQLHGDTMLRELLVNLVTHPFKRENRETIWALKDVSFTIGEGDVVGIIGRNGAGKSTLLKILSKITYPTSGSIRTQGRVASLLEVGTGFHDELTGRENIYLNGSILGMTKKDMDSKLDGIINFADVERFIDTPIKRYSSGMRLRLGFAVAAHLDPDVFLVDEILAVGDADFQKKCLGTMSNLGRGKKTVLFVSHNMAAIENLCSRAIWIDNGQIRKDGDSREVIESYLSTFAGTRQTGSDLSKMESGVSSGAIRYTAIKFLSSDGNTREIIRTGDTLRVRLHYHAQKSVQNPHFGLEIYTELGTLVTSVNTWTAGFNIPFLTRGDGHIEFVIDCFNLMPGRYYVSIWISSIGIKHHRLDHCTFINVEASNYFKSGRDMDIHKFGFIFFPSKWRLDGLQNETETRTYRNVV